MNSTSQSFNEFKQRRCQVEFKGRYRSWRIYYDANRIKVIATIPSKEVLLGKLLGSIQSPIANFARVIKQIAEKRRNCSLICSD